MHTKQINEKKVIGTNEQGSAEGYVLGNIRWLPTFWDLRRKLAIYRGETISHLLNIRPFSYEYLL